MSRFVPPPPPLPLPLSLPLSRGYSPYPLPLPTEDFIFPVFADEAPAVDDPATTTTTTTTATSVEPPSSSSSAPTATTTTTVIQRAIRSKPKFIPAAPVATPAPTPTPTPASTPAGRAPLFMIEGDDLCDEWGAEQGWVPSEYAAGMWATEKAIRAAAARNDYCMAARLRINSTVADYLGDSRVKFLANSDRQDSHPILVFHSSTEIGTLELDKADPAVINWLATNEGFDYLDKDGREKHKKAEGRADLHLVCVGGLFDVPYVLKVDSKRVRVLNGAFPYHPHPPIQWALITEGGLDVTREALVVSPTTLQIKRPSSAYDDKCFYLVAYGVGVTPAVYGRIFVMSRPRWTFRANAPKIENKRKRQRIVAKTVGKMVKRN